MASVYSGYNARTDWLVLRSTILPLCPRADYGPGKTKQKPYNKQLINLKRSVFTGNSETSTLPY